MLERVQQQMEFLQSREPQHILSRYGELPKFPVEAGAADGTEQGGEMSYDPKCEELARHFMESETNWDECDVKELAQWIQDHAEMWLHVREVPK